MPRHGPTDAEWELIADIFPEPARTGRPRTDLRKVLHGILWILHTGAPWRDLPEELGPWQTTWDYFDRWANDGTLDAILDRLRSRRIDAGKIDPELWCVDASNVRGHRSAAGGGKEDDPEEPEDHDLGRSRGGFGSKIHILCDGDGTPLHFEISAGQVHDSKVLGELLDNADAELTDMAGEPLAWPKAAAMDKAYRSSAIDELLDELGIVPVIPSKSNEDREARGVEFDREAYRRRNVVERLIGWLKECRRIFSRFEKTSMNFGGMMKLAFIRQYLKRTGTT